MGILLSFFFLDLFDPFKSFDLFDLIPQVIGLYGGVSFLLIPFFSDGG